MADVLGSAALGAGTHATPRQPAVIAAPAVRWLDELPERVRPNRTAARFPHIVNTLCARWPTPQLCLAYFDELVLDNRGDRKGFPPLIASELALLKDYYESVVFPTQQTAWDHVVHRSRDASGR
jgi:hypothetical protein